MINYIFFLNNVKFLLKKNIYINICNRLLIIIIYFLHLNIIKYSAYYIFNIASNIIIT